MHDDEAIICMLLMPSGYSKFKQELATSTSMTSCVSVTADLDSSNMRTTRDWTRSHALTFQVLANSFHSMHATHGCCIESTLCPYSCLSIKYVELCIP